MKEHKDKHQSPLYKRDHLKQAPSNFNLRNAELIFNKMNIKEGDVFIDLGCGTGNYSLYAAELVGKHGKAFAVDIWAEMLGKVKNEAEKRDFKNVIVIQSDICKTINIEDNAASICFLSNVIHGHKLKEKCLNFFSGIVRILKPDAQLAIIEFKKEKNFWIHLLILE